MTSPGEEVSVFTSQHLNAGTPALGEAKGLIHSRDIFLFLDLISSLTENLSPREVKGLIGFYYYHFFYYQYFNHLNPLN